MSSTSSVAAAAAARRAKILARSKDRMQTVSGGAPIAPSSTASPETDLPPHSQMLSSEKAAAELERALEAVMDAPTATAVAPSTNSSATAATAPPGGAAAVEAVADPHEFMSAADAAAFTPPPSPPLIAVSPSHPFSSFGQLGGPSATALAAARRRRADAASASLDVAPPPTISPLTAWRKRVTTQFRATPPTRMITVGLVCLAALLAGLGILEGGLAWLMMIEILSASALYLTDSLGSAKSKKSAVSKSAASRAAPSMDAPLPPIIPDDDDVIELDTDLYRTKPTPAGPPNPFAAFANMPGMQLPPGMDGAMSSLNLLMKYGQLMRQLMADAMLFVFVSVLVSAVWQLMHRDQAAYA